MIALGADEDTLATYKELTKQDLKTDTTVVNPNERGARDTRMSWIWRLNDSDGDAPVWMDECESSRSVVFAMLIQYCT